MIAPALQKYPLNDQQRRIVAHKTGPLRAIAGPGSGKTYSLLLLAMNLLLCEDAKPSEIVLCTYTDKAADEMQDRLAHIAKEVAYNEDLSQLRIGTIHSICKQFLTEHIHHLPVSNDFETLNQFTQRLLIVEHISEICAQSILPFFQRYWETQTIWEIAKKLQFLFDKITEELIYDKLKAAAPGTGPNATGRDAFRYYLAHAYKRYQTVLARTNRLDFAHLQKCALGLLQDPKIFSTAAKSLRYVLVDEYQDTNYIQERILCLLAQATGKNNICVVGDEDQALYRFRGATVRNILEFEQTFPEPEKVFLSTNYRSHPGIIHFCNEWIKSLDWTNPEGTPFRFDKTIQPDPQAPYQQYASVASVVDQSIEIEAQQFAEIVFSLKEQQRIHDYSHVALLLHSVRNTASQSFIDALTKKGIPTFCSRGRTYFEQEEIQLIIGCLAHLVGYHNTHQEDLLLERNTFPAYIQRCLQLQAHYCRLSPSLEQELSAIACEIVHTTEEATKLPERYIMDYFYRLIFNEPFIEFLSQIDKRQNLADFSQWLQTFQNYYHHIPITWDTLLHIEMDLFHKFFCLLYEEGVNQYNDSQTPFRQGHVSIMTIHQAKGLEFPIVAVGRLDKPPIGMDGNEDIALRDLYDRQGPANRHHVEPAERIPGFDLRRLYYVAFSRAKHVLILMANKKPHQHFASLWEKASAIEYAYDSLRNMPSHHTSVPASPKPRYSFTGHIRMYETCPRQFQYFGAHQFKPSRSATFFLGLLVHQTLEIIHRFAYEGQVDSLTEQTIQEKFTGVVRSLEQRSSVSIASDVKAKALQQVLTYFQNNDRLLHHVVATETNVQVERDDYVLTGKIDLVIKGSKGLEIIDFKTRTRPQYDSKYLTSYQRQLLLYAYAIEKRTKQSPQRLFLYWTAEERGENAMTEVPYNNEDISQAYHYVDEVAANIKRGQFAVLQPPEPEVCQVCNIRHLCRKENII